MATELGEVTSYKRLYLQFRDSAAKTVNLTLNNPKNVDDGDYVDFAAQDATIEGVMDTIISKNIFHNNGNDLVAKVKSCPKVPGTFGQLFEKGGYRQNREYYSLRFAEVQKELSGMKG